ncbi:MAG: hypothetical protein NTZ69_15965 [Bacteroidia bacterium]|nr:hypothetical protein [Bacteroidia bacterium]
MAKTGNGVLGASGSSVNGGSKIGKTKAGARSPKVVQWHPGMSTPF